MIAAFQASGGSTAGCGTTGPVSAGSATLSFAPACAKTDNFKVVIPICTDLSCSPGFKLSGRKFYDQGQIGVEDASDVAQGGFQISITLTDGGTPSTTTQYTDSTTGQWALGNVASGISYSITENLPLINPDGSWWIPTYPAPSQAGVPDTYVGTVGTADVPNLDFGNICVKQPTGGLTLGYWSNNNGQAILTGSKTGTTLTSTAKNILNSYCLVDGKGKAVTGGCGSNIQPATSQVTSSYSAFRSWLLSASATNMAYMLSAQMITTAFDLKPSDGGVLTTGLSGSQVVYAPILQSSGITVANLLSTANNAIIANPYTLSSNLARSTEENLKNTFDSINNNNVDLNGFPVYFIQPPGSCAITYSTP